MNEWETKICDILRKRLGCRCTYKTKPEVACETVSLIIGSMLDVMFEHHTGMVMKEATRISEENKHEFITAKDMMEAIKRVGWVS